MKTFTETPMTKNRAIPAVRIASFEDRPWWTVFLVLFVLWFSLPLQTAFSFSRISSSDGPDFLRAADRESPQDNPLVETEKSVPPDICRHPTVTLSPGKLRAVLTCSHDAPLVKIFPGKTFFAVLKVFPEMEAHRRKAFLLERESAFPSVSLPVSSPPPNFLRG